MFKYALLDYVPQRYLRRASFDTLENDRFILDFKSGRRYAIDKASRLIGKALSLMDLKDTVIVCIPAVVNRPIPAGSAIIPASCQQTYTRRFRSFSAKLSAMCGAIDGFEHIHVIGKREKVHICGEYAAEDNVWIDEDFFKGKRILLIDDICTSGRTSDAFKERMESAGAHVRMAMFLAKTKNYRRTNNYKYN